MKRLLLIKTGAFGDIVLSSVSINIAAKIFTEYEIYFLTGYQYAEIYRDCPFIKKIFILPRKNNFRSFLRFVKELRKEKFDIIVDLQGNLKTNFLCFILGGKERIGLYKRSLGKIFLTRGIKKKSGLNPILFQETLWNKITGEKIDGNLQIWIGDNRKKSFDIFLKQNGLEVKKYVVFHPSASPEWKTKLWLKDNWISLAKFFLEKNLKVVLMGDKNSIKLNSEIATSMKDNIIDLSGKTDFFTLALLIKNSIILLTTDSGPMHVGAATGVETIAIFGPTNPEIHCPPGIKFLTSDVHCSFCYKKNCRVMSCMKEITPDKVKRTIKIEKLNTESII